MASQHSTRVSQKRGREEMEEGAAFDFGRLDVPLPQPLQRPSDATPTRSTQQLMAGDAAPSPFVNPHCCAFRALDDDSRSRSVDTAATDGLSEDSIFFLDLSSSHRAEGGSVPSITHHAPHAGEADGELWQQQLCQFFARLDQRPLNVVHKPAGV